MSIQSIDGVSSTRPARMPEMFTDMPPESAPPPQSGSFLQRLITTLMQGLIGAGTQGPSGANGAGGGGGGGGGLGLLGSIVQLLESLGPLLQSLDSGGMKPNAGSSQVANQLGRRTESPAPSAPSFPSPPPPTSSAPAPSAPAPVSPSPTASPPASPVASAPESAPTSSGKAGAIPRATGEVVVNEPIVVRAGTTFDGGGKLYKAGASLGDGGQSEGQKPVFILENGAKLQNLQVQGADGVHVNGDATVQNVWWKDVGEDALTKKGKGDVKIIGGGALDAHDKIFQVNAGGSLSIEGFTAENFGRGVAQNGGTDFPLQVSIKNSSFTNGDELFRTDSPNAKILLQGVTLNNVNYDARGPRGMEVTGGEKIGWL